MIKNSLGKSNISQIVAPTSMTDEEATKLGLKQYRHGSTYNSGIAPTIGGTDVTSVFRGLLIPYQMQDGTWRLRFNIKIDTNSVTGLTITINGVTFKNVGNFYQPVTIQAVGAAPYHGTGTTQPNTNQIGCASATSAATWGLSGDVELDSKPTWAF